MKEKILISNIQRFSLQDGPGIRTTLFLKGCNLRCPWCANPENLENNIKKIVKDNREYIFGYYMEVEKLKEELIKDKSYYELNNGGVTFSGGEPLLQFKKLEKLLIELKSENINMCIETSLFAPKEMLEIAIKYIDEFIVDVKILDKNICKKVLGGNINNFYQNLDELFSKKKNINIRIPVTKEFTFNEKEDIINLLKKYSPKKVEIFKIHNLAEKKYDILGMKINKFHNITNDELESFRRELKDIGCNVEICKL